jgi:hypothetical protein
VPAHIRTFLHISSILITTGVKWRRLVTQGGEHFRDFPVAAVLAEEHKQARASTTKPSKGNRVVHSSRAKTGFGGMITVTVVLLIAQLITGARAFPL